MKEEILRLASKDSLFRLSLIQEKTGDSPEREEILQQLLAMGGTEK